MLDVTLLGTGGYMPMKDRRLASALMRSGGHSLLIDCGEGTQTAMRECGLSFKAVDAILITHFHADHISGLPGLLLSMGNDGRTEPVTVAGPKHIDYVTKCLCVIAPALPYEVRFIPIESDCTFELSPFCIEAFALDHSMPCLGYALTLARAGRFNAAKAEMAGIPKRLWGRLQNGETVEHDGHVFAPQSVMGSPRRGIRVCYTTDTRPTERIVVHAADADLMICEGMYGEADMEAHANERGHMTMMQAAKLALASQPEELWLTHFSPAVHNPSSYEENVRSVFSNAHAGYDGMQKTLSFIHE